MAVEAHRGADGQLVAVGLPGGEVGGLTEVLVGGQRVVADSPAGQVGGGFDDCDGRLHHAVARCADPLPKRGGLPRVVVQVEVPLPVFPDLDQPDRHQALHEAVHLVDHVDVAQAHCVLHRDLVAPGADHLSPGRKEGNDLVHAPGCGPDVLVVEKGVVDEGVGLLVGIGGGVRIAPAEVLEVGCPAPPLGQVGRLTVQRLRDVFTEGLECPVGRLAGRVLAGLVAEHRIEVATDRREFKVPGRGHVVEEGRSAGLA